MGKVENMSYEQMQIRSLSQRHVLPPFHRANVPRNVTDKERWQPHKAANGQSISKQVSVHMFRPLVRLTFAHVGLEGSLSRRGRRSIFLVVAKRWRCSGGASSTGPGADLWGTLHSVGSATAGSLPGPKGEAKASGSTSASPRPGGHRAGPIESVRWGGKSCAGRAPVSPPLLSATVGPG